MRDLDIGQRQRGVGRPTEIHPVEIPLVGQGQRTAGCYAECRRPTHHHRLVGRLHDNACRNPERADCDRHIIHYEVVRGAKVNLGDSAVVEGHQRGNRHAQRAGLVIGQHPLHISHHSHLKIGGPGGGEIS